MVSLINVYSQVSESLQHIVGIVPIPRTQITKKIWDYIKYKSLQDPIDKRYILCDSIMERVFKTKRLFMMDIAKILTKHLIPIPKSIEISKPYHHGFNKLYTLSKPLQQLLKEKYLSRPQVIKQLWIYIKENTLQDSRNMQYILNDMKMKQIFNVSKMSMFEMNQLIGDHLLPYHKSIHSTPIHLDHQKLDLTKQNLKT
ncbi:SWIB/MDM2 domain-containing protein [Globomyces pollinis-pini]|nr:SWIB/MDM2 domain-containing protein [Globomyces pollinis-pini]